MTGERKRILGWMFFDWASQPYSTLLLTFIFAPYMQDLLGSGSAAQTVWGLCVGATGIAIALASPFLGAIADRSGRRMEFVRLFSAMYVAGAFGLWFAVPGNFSLWFVLLSFAIGLIGMEFATTFTNAMLPGLAPKGRIGQVSGSGWAFGYLGGLLALVAMIGFLQISPKTGHTLFGLPPLFGLDPATRADTRIVGPLVALWYAVFMIPFFLWVREARPKGSVGIGTALRGAGPELRDTLRTLPRQRALWAFLLAAMIYRDALNGIFTFAGVYARGVLGWTITQIALFGILGTVFGALFAWAGGRADDRFGPRPVIVTALLTMIIAITGVVLVSRETVFGRAVGTESLLPDIAFYVIGAVAGAAGGAMQTASRTMMARLADPSRTTESFGLYALTGKATAFLGPLSVSLVTWLSGSQRIGVIPLIVLLTLGLALLIWGRTRTTSLRAEEGTRPAERNRAL